MSVDIKRLRELEQGMIKAPWGSEFVNDYESKLVGINKEDGEHGEIGYIHWAESADEIAEMRNALPALLDELEQMRKEREVRPLTLVEVMEHRKDEFAKPLWASDVRGSGIWMDVNKLKEYEFATLDLLYSRKWRFWRNRPTPEQSSAVPWEGDR